MATTAVAESSGGAVSALAATQTMEALTVIRKFVAQQLQDGLDYGTIPGAGTKKVMLLPGAQKVTMLFNCWPRHTVRVNEIGNGHCEVQVTTELVSRTTDAIVGSGVGSCSTMESKYRWRRAGRRCPQCDAEAIIKGRDEYGGGFICFKKKGGCGAKFADDAPAIVSQPEGRVENDDIYDQRNTVLKMAKKRATVDAAIGLGCLTELFTQDLEEDHAPADEPTPNKPAPTRKPAPTEVPAKVSTPPADERRAALKLVNEAIGAAKDAGTYSVDAYRGLLTTLGVDTTEKLATPKLLELAKLVRELPRAAAEPQTPDVLAEEDRGDAWLPDDGKTPAMAERR